MLVQIAFYAFISICMLSLGFGLSSYMAACKLEKAFTKKSFAEMYYSFALISLSNKTIDYYCGMNLVASDNFDIAEVSKLRIGVYTAIIKGNIITILNDDGNSIDPVKIDIGREYTFVSRMFQDVFSIVVVD